MSSFSDVVVEFLGLYSEISMSKETIQNTLGMTRTETEKALSFLERKGLVVHENKSGYVLSEKAKSLSGGTTL